MTNSHRDKETRQERVARDPIGVEDAWLRATEEGTGQDTLEGAIDVATGADPQKTHDRVVNGYRHHNTSPTEPPGPENTPDVGAHPH